MRHSLWLILVLIAVLAVGSAIFIGFSKESIPAVQLQRQDITATLTVTGEVYADTMVSFSSPVSARIVEITVDEGDAIAPDQLLVRLDTAQIQQQLSEVRSRAAQAQAAYANVRQGTRPEQLQWQEERYEETLKRVNQAQAALSSGRAKALEAKHNAERMQSLFKQEFISQQEAENAQTQADVTQQEVNRLEADLSAVQTQKAQAAAQLSQARHGPTAPEINEAAAASKAAQATAQQIQAQMVNYLIRSNINGIVTQRVQDPGELAMPGQPVLKAVNPQTLQIKCSVEENDLAKIKLGDTAYVVLDARPEVAIEGVVKRIGSQVNPENGTVEMRVILTEAGWKKLHGLPLLPGMTADVNVVTDRLRQALVVPATAVRQDDGQWVVYRFQGDKLIRQPVKGQRLSVEHFVVTQGLDSGDWISQTAGETLTDKQRVQPQKITEETKPAAKSSSNLSVR